MSSGPIRGWAIGWRELLGSPLAADPHSTAGATIRELKRQYDKRVKLPQALVEELTRTSVLGQQAWVSARANNDFASFRPLLDKTFRLKREQAQALGYPERPYDALLDDFEPGALTSEVAKVLAALRERLVPLVAEIAASSRRANIDLLTRHFPREAQEQFGQAAAAQVGFEFARGRLDVTAHPFCSGLGPHDCRITTRYDERHFPGGVLRHPARGGAWHLRPRTAARALRPAAGRRRVAGDSRVAIADVGEPRRPQPRVLGLFLPAGASGVSRSAGRMCRSTIFISP